MNSNHTKSLLFMIPAIIILLLVIVAKIVNKPAPVPDQKTASFIDPNLHRMEDTIDSKQRVYAHGQQVEELKSTEKKVNFDELGEMAKNNGNKLGYRPDTLLNPNRLTTTRGSVYDATVHQQPSVASHVHTQARASQPEKVVESAKNPEVLPEAPKKVYADLCVVVSKNNQSGANKFSRDDFIPAYLEEDTKITDKASVVFILDRNCICNSIPLNKNAILFGTVVNAGSRFDIFIHNVKNTDGTTYDFSNVLVYNEKYGRGIVPEGTISKALKQSADQSANNATGDLGYSTNAGTNLAGQGLSNTVAAVTGSRTPSITLSQGYKVFIKVLPKS
jgi:hypothetical protein